MGEQEEPVVRAGWRCLPRSTTRGGDGVVGGPLLRTRHGGLIGLACDVPESCWRCGAALRRVLNPQWHRYDMVLGSIEERAHGPWCLHCGLGPVAPSPPLLLYARGAHVASGEAVAVWAELFEGPRLWTPPVVGADGRPFGPSQRLLDADEADRFAPVLATVREGMVGVEGAIDDTDRAGGGFDGTGPAGRPDRTPRSPLTGARAEVPPVPGQPTAATRARTELCADTLTMHQVPSRPSTSTAPPAGGAPCESGPSSPSPGPSPPAEAGRRRRRRPGARAAAPEAERLAEAAAERRSATELACRFMSAGGSGGDADFGDHATARAVEAALSATVHALPPALEPPRHGGELWELLRRRWCELTAPWRELIAAGTSWRELLQDLELRLDLDLGSEDDFEDREYVRGLFEAEYAEAMSYEGHD